MRTADKPKNKRSEQADATREKIFKAARKLFGKKGYDRVGMDDIAEAAGVSVGSCYHHFGSKYKIFQEVYKRSDKYFRQEVPSLLAAESWTGKVIEFFEVYYGGLIESDGVDLCRQLYVPTNDLFLREDSGMTAVLAEIIGSGQKAGEILAGKSAKELAEFLFVVARGVVFDWCLHHGSYNVRASLGEHIEATIMAFKITDNR